MPLKVWCVVTHYVAEQLAFVIARLGKIRGVPALRKICYLLLNPIFLVNSVCIHVHTKKWHDNVG